MLKKSNRRIGCFFLAEDLFIHFNIKCLWNFEMSIKAGFFIFFPHHCVCVCACVAPSGSLHAQCVWCPGQWGYKFGHTSLNRGQTACSLSLSFSIGSILTICPKHLTDSASQGDPIVPATEGRGEGRHLTASKLNVTIKQISLRLLNATYYTHCGAGAEISH